MFIFIRALETELRVKMIEKREDESDRSLIDVKKTFHNDVRRRGHFFKFQILFFTFDLL